MPAKYDSQTREKAVRLVREHRDEYASEWEAIKTVSGRLGTNAETLRKWLRQAEIDSGQAEGVTTAAAREIRDLKRKNAELEQTVEILKAATSSFVRESDPRQR
jgi:transposase